MKRKSILPGALFHCNNLDMLQYCIKYGAVINHTNYKDGPTAFANFVQGIYKNNNNLEMAIYLLDQHGLEIMQCPENHKVIIAAAAKNTEYIVEKLLKLGVNANILEENNKDGLLHYAVKNKNYKMAKSLLERNINLNYRSYGGRTAIMEAISHDNFEMVKLISNYCKNFKFIKKHENQNLFKENPKYLEYFKNLEKITFEGKIFKKNIKKAKNIANNRFKL